jgi:hypothetical protein
MRPSKEQGTGFYDRPGTKCLNHYRPPTIKLGNPAEDRWTELHPVFVATPRGRTRARWCSYDQAQ